MAVEIFHYDCIPQNALPPAMKFLLTKWNTLSVMQKLTLQAMAESSSVNVLDNSAYMVPAGEDFHARGQERAGRDRARSYRQAVIDHKHRHRSGFARCLRPGGGT